MAKVDFGDIISTRKTKKPTKIFFDKHQKKAREFLTKVAKKTKEPMKKGLIKRIPTGIPGLDELIEGGFEQGSTILSVGSAGTGKTTFGLQFLYYGAMKYKEPGIFISFEEDKKSLFTHASVFDWKLEEMEKKGLIKVLQYKPHQVEKLIKEGGGPIRDAIRVMKAKRLVIDSITAYTMLFKDDYQKRESILDLLVIVKESCTESLCERVAKLLVLSSEMFSVPIATKFSRAVIQTQWPPGVVGMLPLSATFVLDETSVPRRFKTNV